MGTVENIKLAADMKSVVVQVRMVGGTEAMLTDRARFWVVRPRLSAGNLTGIETLVSGAYIEVDPGEPGGKKQRRFTALPQPPGRQSDEPGQVYVLKAKRLGSLSTGSPVYYRDVEVGEVLSHDLGGRPGSGDAPGLRARALRQVRSRQTQFWNASGLSVTMGAEGLRLEVQSIQTLLSGGIAFETKAGGDSDAAAAELEAFDLYEDKAAADDAFYREKIPYVSYFRGSVRGLAAGLPCSSRAYRWAA